MRVLGRIRWTAMVVSMPLVSLGLLALGVQVYSLVRYDPVYFAAEYLERYDGPDKVARALEAALRTGDGILLAELQGLRSPSRFKASPAMALVMLLDSSDRYTTYLYLDRGSYERKAHHVEHVDGRWVVAPEDLYYHLNSGRWQLGYLRLAMAWWLMSALALGALWLARRSGRLREWLYGDGR
ncbi:hypothetical protein ACFLT5_00760 [Chloroflexota bacterium]